MNLSPGTEVAAGQYVVKRILGSGGMAVVYKVARISDGKVFALKVLNTTDSGQQGRLLREGRAQAALQHPHVVVVTEVLQIDGQPALLMEYVGGPTLDRALKRVSFTLEQIDDLARGLLEGMAAAHRADFIHRDLKPANILLAMHASGVVAKIADFGLVKTADATGSTVAATRTGAMLGTPAYMAPEQVRDAKDVDARADVFALGAILYELVTRRRAFDGQDTFDVFEAIVRGRYPSLDELLPDLPARMRTAIDMALSVERADRYPSAVELLEAWVGGTPAPSNVWNAAEVASVQAAAAAGVEPGHDPTWPSMEPEHAPASAALLAGETVDSTLDAPPGRPTPTSRSWARRGAAGLALGAVASGVAFYGFGDSPVAETTDRLAVSDPVVIGGDTLVWTENLPATTLNPLFIANATDARVADLLFEPLFFRSPISEELTSRIVDAWYPEQKGSRLILELFEQLKWSDGAPLDAEDVCFTFEAMVDPKVQATTAQEADAVLDCVVLDALRVALDFARPMRDPELYAAWHILPEHAFDGDGPHREHAFSSAPVGSGPLVGHLDGTRVHFEANPHDSHPVFTTSQASVRKGLLIGGESQDEQLARLQNGQSHGMIEVSPGFGSTLAASDELALKSYAPQSLLYIALNPRSDLLDDPAVRRAVDYAIDRDKLIAATIGVDPADPNPPATPIAGPFLSSSGFAHPDIAPTRYDAQAAVREMEAAGAELVEGRWQVDGEPATLRVAMQASADRYAPGLLAALTAQAEAGGFALVSETMPEERWRAEVLSGRARNDFDAAIGVEFVRAIEDPGPLLHSRYRGLGQRNAFSWSNTEVDRLLDLAAQAEEKTDAIDALREAHRIAHEDRPYVFLWQQNIKSAWHHEVRNNLLAPGHYFSQFRSWRLDR